MNERLLDACMKDCPASSRRKCSRFSDPIQEYLRSTIVARLRKFSQSRRTTTKHKNKKQMKAKLFILALGLAGLAYTLTAQDNGAPPSDGSGPDRPRMGRRPIHPLMQALDANKDGTLDEQEIANASAALKALDKNGDGKLTPDELRPAFPPGGERGPGGPGFHRPPPDGQQGDQGQRPQQ
jgi:hypothetical protein